MDQQSKTESRRKFLKTAGKFAVYTPPALMLMSKADAHRMAHSPRPNGDYSEKKKEYYEQKRSIIISILRWLFRSYG